MIFFCKYWCPPPPLASLDLVRLLCLHIYKGTLLYNWRYKRITSRPWPTFYHLCVQYRARSRPEGCHAHQIPHQLYNKQTKPFKWRIYEYDVKLQNANTCRKTVRQDLTYILTTMQSSVGGDYKFVCLILEKGALSNGFEALLLHFKLVHTLLKEY